LSSIALYIREQRHIFGICPHCKSLFRLVDARVSYKTPYKADWLDEIEGDREKWQTKTEDLKGREKELRRLAIERATKRDLPKLLKRVVPTFVNRGLNPQDIKTVFHPIDFVVFDGLNDEGTERVVLMDHKTSEKARITVQEGISDAIKSGAIEWKTLRVSETGEITPH
jgi:predicted Holliday junction resolvase-like endonuclease